MSGTNQIFTLVICILTFFLGLFVGSIFDAYESLTFINFVSVIATLLAAFLAAYFAFMLETLKEEEINRKRNMVAGNLVLFDLTKMLNILLNYQHQIIYPIRNDELAFINMRNIREVPIDINLNLDNLAFLLELGNAGANLLGELSRAELKFRNTMEIIYERSQFYKTRINPILEKADVKENIIYDIKFYNKQLGSQNISQMKHVTGEIITFVDSTINSMQETSNNLTSALQEAYPKDKIGLVKAV